jgi:hypothetical protein
MKNRVAKSPDRPPAERAEIANCKPLSSHVAGAKRSTKRRRCVGGETVTHDIFGDDARDEELQQVVAAAGFRSAARHLESAEGMPADDGTGAGAIDINVARDQLRFDALNIGRAAGEKSPGQRVVGVVRDPDGFIEIAHSNDAQDRSENLFTRETHLGFHIGENRW